VQEIAAAESVIELYRFLSVESEHRSILLVLTVIC
jgi:hypothetical protein